MMQTTVGQQNLTAFTLFVSSIYKKMYISNSQRINLDMYVAWNLRGNR